MSRGYDVTKSCDLVGKYPRPGACDDCRGPVAGLHNCARQRDTWNFVRVLGRRHIHLEYVVLYTSSRSLQILRTATRSWTLLGTLWPIVNRMPSNSGRCIGGTDNTMDTGSHCLVRTQQAGHKVTLGGHQQFASRPVSCSPRFILKYMP